MKSRDNHFRLRRFEADEKSRKVADLESMIREFENIVSDLDRQIMSEEDRTGVKDIHHFAYSTFAKAAAQRRDNLRISIDDLKVKLEVAVAERDAAMSNLAKVEADEIRTVGRRRGISIPDARAS